MKKLIRFVMQTGFSKIGFVIILSMLFTACGPPNKSVTKADHLWFFVNDSSVDIVVRAVINVDTLNYHLENSNHTLWADNTYNDKLIPIDGIGHTAAGAITIANPHDEYSEWVGWCMNRYAYSMRRKPTRWFIGIKPTHLRQMKLIFIINLVGQYLKEGVLNWLQAGIITRFTDMDSESATPI